MTIRFAPIIRVSTEKQRDKGKSLETQKAQIIQYVKILGGVIPEECWKYCGQEHSTPGYERKLLDQLLSDSSKNLFDAVITTEPSRWSRDNQKSGEGLDILDKNNIKFYAGTTQYVINSKKDPVSYYMLSNFVALSQMVAHQQANKSRLGRETAWLDGRPCVNHKPYGRLYDKKTRTWSLDAAKVAEIKDAVNKFLAGMTREKIAIGMSINDNTLWKIFRDYLGDTWTTRKMGTMKIPPLIDDPKIIEAVHRRIQSNKTVTHNPRGKHAYLLSGVIFCADCGLSMSGVPCQLNKTRTDESKYRYWYQHQKKNNIRTCLNLSRWEVPAEAIETAVMVHIYSILGDKEKIEAALAAAIPDIDQKEEMRSEIAKYQEDLKRLETRKSKLIDAVADGILVGQEIKIKMDEIKSKEAEIKSEIEIREKALENIRSKKDLSIYAQMIADARVTIAEHKSVEDFLNIPFAKKRKILESIFTGKDPQGKKFGVYISSTKEGHWRRSSYTINANAIGIIKGSLPMDEWEVQELVEGVISKSVIC